ncbi:hypothetical protein SAMN05216299_107115 [Nitrosospira sp. Nsp14]|uniref:hypothetical protein n=1 Tax=Nitrosospira sp. Nsp14 TaxID=1855333 RepID=UPI0008EF5506|nr:hypothetical protein [Nitrosospira sp. Nsp14]SFH34246.1 hypothetical protein SAMN05216299_107115 [Nitrosospira sp. Nsp14]
MRNVAYKGIETAVSLLLTYEAIALAHRKREEEETLSDGQMNFRHSFVLLILNASIIEGTLRSILSERLLQDIRIATEMERKQGHAILAKTERSLSERHSDLEMQGGWEKLKEHYSFYFDRSLNKAVKKDLWEAIEVLFVLRNVLSHGTAIVQSDVKMGETMKDMYPYNWQTKLQRASVYLDKVFGKTDVFLGSCYIFSSTTLYGQNTGIVLGCGARFWPFTCSSR